MTQPTQAPTLAECKRALMVTADLLDDYASVTSLNGELLSRPQEVSRQLSIVYELIARIEAQIKIRDGERITTDDLLSRWIDEELTANPGMAERVRMTVQLTSPQGAGR